AAHPAPTNRCNQAKPVASIEGTQRALGAGMRDADRIEAINSEQLATATDRLLLRASRQRFARGSQARIAYAAPQPAPARFAQGSQFVVPGQAAPRAEGSQPRIAIAPHAEGSQPRIAIAPHAQGSQPCIVPSGQLAHVAQEYSPRAEGSQPCI